MERLPRALLEDALGFLCACEVARTRLVARAFSDFRAVWTVLPRDAHVAQSVLLCHPKRVRELELTDKWCDERVLSLLTNFTELQSLELDGRIRDEWSFAAALGCLSGLLCLSLGALSPRAAQAVGHSLRRLRADFLDPACLPFLRHLEELSMSRLINSDTMVELSQLQTLRILRLGTHELDTENALRLQALQNLEVLALHVTDVCQPLGPLWKELPKLRDLTFEGPEPALCPDTLCPSLRALSLDVADLSTLAPLGRLSRLQCLQLFREWFDLSDHVMQFSLLVPSLCLISVWSATTAGSSRPETWLPREIAAATAALRAAVLERIPDDVSSCRGSCWPCLEWLRLEELGHLVVPTNVVPDLSGLSRLTHVVIRESHDEYLGVLRSLPRLLSLSLTLYLVTDATVKILSEIATLRWLKLKTLRLSDAFSAETYRILGRMPLLGFATNDCEPKLAHLSGASLEQLDLRLRILCPEELRHCRDMPRLRKLRVHGYHHAMAQSVCANTGIVVSDSLSDFGHLPDIPYLADLL